MSAQNGKDETRGMPTYDHAAIASDVPLCSRMGRDILKQGGSVVDAAITTALCLGVVNPQSSGIGGGFMLTVYLKDQGIVDCLDVREAAPLDIDETFNFKEETEESVGPMLICLPTEIAGMWAAHQRYGKLPWAKLFEPALKLAEEGYPMTHHTRFSIEFREDRDQSLDEKIMKRYTNPDGSIKEPGDWVTHPILGKTLRMIAQEGPDVFYHGEIPKRLAEEVQALGGVLSAEDFAVYQPRWKTPRRSHLKDNLFLYSPENPAAGPTLQLIVRTMIESGFGPEDFEDFESKVKVYNRYVALERLAMGLRRNLGDVDTNEVKSILNTMYTEDFAKLLAKKLVLDDVKTEKCDDSDFIIQYGEDGCTTQISIVAENGDAVAMTSTIGKYFGSGIQSETLGFVFNSHIKDFRPGGINELAPGKRPLSAICGSIVIDEVSGDVQLVTGGAGARRIVSANAWIILRFIFTGLCLPDAVAERRVYSNFQNIALFEEGFPKNILVALRKSGQDVDYEGYGRSIVNAVGRLSNGKLISVPDPRKGKEGSGY